MKKRNIKQAKSKQKNHITLDLLANLPHGVVYAPQTNFGIEGNAV